MSRYPVVTMHALRRYAERSLGEKLLPKDDIEALAELHVRGVDVAGVRAAIIAATERGMALGAMGVKHDGIRYVLDGETVMTVMRVKVSRLRRRPRIERHRD